MVFDCAVNQGISFAVKTLQRISGAEPDGIVGPKTLQAVQLLNLNDLLVYAEFRNTRYFNLKTVLKFGKGWTNRLMHVIHFTLLEEKKTALEAMEKEIQNVRQSANTGKKTRGGKRNKRNR
jgi:lysozyme family protein